MIQKSFLSNPKEVWPYRHFHFMSIEERRNVTCWGLVVEKKKGHNCNNNNTFMKETMKNWRVELTEEEKNLVEQKIWRGIFQRDAI